MERRSHTPHRPHVITVTTGLRHGLSAQDGLGDVATQHCQHTRHVSGWAAHGAAFVSVRRGREIFLVPCLVPGSFQGGTFSNTRGHVAEARPSRDSSFPVSHADSLWCQGIVGFVAGVCSDGGTRVTLSPPRVALKSAESWPREELSMVRAYFFLLTAAAHPDVFPRSRLCKLRLEPLARWAL